MGNVVGELKIMSVYSPELKMERTVRVLTPPTELDLPKPFGVIYMHDGQNLFDADTAFSGEWEFDEALFKYSQKTRRGFITVGIDNTPNRLNELCPPFSLNEQRAENFSSSWKDNIPAPCGDRYVDFLAETLIPYISSSFPVADGKKNCFIGGSSMGGLISAYAVARYPELFGGMICFSPAFAALGESGRSELIKLVSKGNISELRSYYYVGGSGFEADFVQPTREYHKAMRCYFPDAATVYSEKPENGHFEVAWREELPAALDFILSY